MSLVVVGSVAYDGVETPHGRVERIPVPARVTAFDGGNATVELLTPEESVAPGQACVFYDRDGSRVLGGGWIARAEPLNSPLHAVEGSMGIRAAGEDVAVRLIG